MFRMSRFQWMVHLLCMTPFFIAIIDGVGGNLTANPIQDISKRTGLAALTILLISLSATPLNSFFGFKAALKARRALGLYAFLYAALHLFIFIFLDYGGNFTLIWLDISNKLYILVGSLAFFILLVLAITSARYWKKRLGKNWNILHRLVYLASFLVIAHYIWAVKADFRDPLVYLVILSLLLVLRIPVIKLKLSAFSLFLVNKVHRKNQPS